MGLVQSVAPTVEPLTIEEAKLHLRVDAEDENTAIAALIQSAREYVENFTGRQLITATYQWSLDAFVGVLYLPKPPLQSVTTVAYTDGDGNGQTVSSANYQVDTASQPGRVVPSYSKTWPTTRNELNAVVVTYKAGYGDTALNVPEQYKTAMKLLIGHWFENREAIITGMAAKETPLAADAVLSPFRMAQIA